SCGRPSRGRSSRYATRCGSSACCRRCSSPRFASSAALPRTAPSSSCGSLALLLPATARPDDQVVGFLVLAARALAERRHAPGGDRMATALRLALAPAVGVVDGVHRRAAHRGAFPAPPAPPRLAAGLVFVVDVPDLADGGPAG